MSVPLNIRTTFGFYPPEDNPAAWQANLETFSAALGRAFPDGVLEQHVDALRGVDVLDFDIEIAPDVWITGTAALPTPDYAYITLGNVTADEAAAFAQWLRDSYVPSPAAVRFISSAAMANGEETPTPLPAMGDATEIEAALRAHLTAAGIE
ncbi:hypothetical protein DF268_07635 [Streptomyces sp. V2]|uniref:Uncharacterized protein n=1 Tax=Streptomyces niveiscabiei TaxID=164115 RepID=A0ABW9HYD5_9ACTN|nr:MULTISPECIES: hypothetical protein [Streptomyces]PWG14106.1 hypothetical protein DF268_07635 [Streptomyces sp. V2]